MRTRLLGNPDSRTVLVQMVDDHDLQFIENEFQLIRESACKDDFSLLTVKVDDWNHDLSPWNAPPVFGDASFGDGAEHTLSLLLDRIIPDYVPKNAVLYIGGYSLSGLFALWAASNCPVFKGVAAASPSVWFPDFVQYSEKNSLKAEAVYLSLGDKEEKTRNPLMATVGDAVRRLFDIYSASGIPCTLEWNPGNHFREPDVRMAKGFSWLLNRK